MHNIADNEWDSPKTLDPLSEMMTVSTYGNTKNRILTFVEVQGSGLDGVAEEGFRRAVAVNPDLLTCLREVRSGFKRILVRAPDQTLEPLFVARDAPPGTEYRSSLDCYLTVFRDVLDRPSNLFSEPPLELHLLRMPDGRRITGPVLHHYAGDAARGAEFGREFLAQSEFVATGRYPDWAGEPQVMSTARKRAAGRAPLERSRITQARHAILNAMERPVLPIGSGDPADIRQFHVKRVLHEHLTDRLISRSSARGATLIDRLVATSNMTIDEWNGRRGCSPGLLTTSISVNMRGRFTQCDASNNSAVVFFRYGPAERRDPAAFIKAVAADRIRALRRHDDFRFYQDVSRLNTMLRPAPFRVKLRIASKIINMHGPSIAITLLGSLWPRLKSNRPTLESHLTHVGDVEIKEVHGSGYKLLSGADLLLLVYVYHKKLNFIMVAAARRFTRDEAGAFVDEVLHKLTGGEAGIYEAERVIRHVG